MTSNTILRYLTSASFQLLKTNSRTIRSRNIYTLSLVKGWCSRRKEVPGGPMVIKSNNCTERDAPILEPMCNTAVVIGGNGFGFAAADYLLCKGALGVVILDDDSVIGESAAKKLCDDYGRERAHFICCDTTDCCEFEAVLNLAICKYEKIRVIFNDLDKKRYPINALRCHPNQNSNKVASKVMGTGLRIMSKQSGGPGGIIVSCASLLGFIDFPEDPFPIYCKKEAAIETTMHYAKEYDVTKTGVRLVTLCPINKSFSKIALPCLPKPIPKNKRNEIPPCIPSSHEKIGPALGYTMAWAKNGSTWVVEPTSCPTENPRQIFFPSGDGDKVDPKMYNIKHQLCPVSLGKHSMKVPSKDEKCSCESTARKEH